MDLEQIIQQTKVENKALGYETRALEVAIAWAVKGGDCSRKLSSVRFATDMFQRHLERVFSLEELDGYMEVVCELQPELTDQVAVLKREHDQFREAVRKLVRRLERTSPSDVVRFDAICSDLRNVIRQILEHSRRENELLVESTDRDTGGEG